VSNITLKLRCIQKNHSLLRYRALERVVRDIEPLARKHKSRLQTMMPAKSDREKIRDAVRGMDEAFNKFTASPLLTSPNNHSNRSRLSSDAITDEN
jgi:hypothetical protein